MNQPLRQFTERGLQRFQEAYRVARESNPKQLMNVKHLVNDPELTILVSDAVDVQPIRFKNWFETGNHFASLFAEVSDDLRRLNIRPLVSKKLWAWLSALWSDVLQFEEDGVTPAKKVRYGHVGEEARWIYDYASADRWYRHLLAAPYRIFNDFADDPLGALILLDVELIHPNKRRLEVICGSPNFYAHQSLVSNLSKQFRNPLTGNIRDEIEIFENHRGEGSFDRITKVFNQLLKNYDLHQLTPQQIKTHLLNNEFDGLLKV
jgi:hypothetical protein